MVAQRKRIAYTKQAYMIRLNDPVAHRTVEFDPANYVYAAARLSHLPKRMARIAQGGELEQILAGAAKKGFTGGHGLTKVVRNHDRFDAESASKTRDTQHDVRLFVPGARKYNLGLLLFDESEGNQKQVRTKRQHGFWRNTSHAATLELAIAEDRESYRRRGRVADSHTGLGKQNVAVDFALPFPRVLSTDEAYDEISALMAAHFTGSTKYDIALEYLSHKSWMSPLLRRAFTNEDAQFFVLTGKSADRTNLSRSQDAFYAATHKVLKRLSERLDEPVGNKPRTFTAMKPTRDFVGSPFETVSDRYTDRNGTEIHIARYEDQPPLVVIHELGKRRLHSKASVREFDGIHPLNRPRGYEDINDATRLETRVHVLRPDVFDKNIKLPRVLEGMYNRVRKSS